MALNYENSKVVNFTALRIMILEVSPPVRDHSTRKNKRKQFGVVVSEPETKGYKVVFKKRRHMHNFESVTYGYESSIYLFFYLFFRNKYK